MTRRPAPDSAADVLVPARRSSALPLIGEAMTPWLGGAFVLAAVNLGMVVAGRSPSTVEQSLLLMGLCAALGAGALVSARSNRVLEALISEERARPSVDQLTSAESQAASYAECMATWAAAVIELLDHAVASTEAASPAHAELAAAAAEARDLRDLLQAEPAELLTINDQARLHALGSLWETSLRRLEHLAAEVDPVWHRRWRARSVAVRRLRHGRDPQRPLVLPYRS